MRRSQRTSWIAVALSLALLSGCGSSHTATGSTTPTAEQQVSTSSPASVVQRPDASVTRAVPPPTGATGAPSSTAAGSPRQATTHHPQSTASLSSQLLRLALTCSGAPRVMPPGAPGTPAFTLFAQQVAARAQALTVAFSGAVTVAGGPGSALGVRLKALQSADASAMHLAQAAQQASNEPALAPLLTQAVATVDGRAHEAKIPGCGMLILVG